VECRGGWVGPMLWPAGIAAPETETPLYLRYSSSSFRRRRVVNGENRRTASRAMEGEERCASMTRWTRAIDLLVETQNGFNDGGYPQHLACGDFLLRRHNHLLARLDAGRAAAMELCGAQPRHY